MKEKTDDMMMKRVPVDTLIRYARAVSKARPADPRKEVERRSREMGERIRSCTVHGFYEAFILEHVSNEDEFLSVQEWIDDCIAVALGLSDVLGLTMADLASRIAEKMQQDDLSYEDRWVLYELCFFLTAQMARLDEQFFAERHQCTRLGTPGEMEPQSLYCRVMACRRKAGTETAVAVPKARVRIDELLRSAGGGAHALSEHTRLSLPDLKIGPVLDCLLTAKYNLNTDDQLDAFCLFDSSSRFVEMFEMYTGMEWSATRNIAELANMMTWAFWLKIKDADDNGIERARVLQAYELCYEFINVLASPEHDLGHVSLMVREGMDSKYDVDERAKADAMGSIE